MDVMQLNEGMCSFSMRCIAIALKSVHQLGGKIKATACKAFDTLVHFKEKKN